MNTERIQQRAREAAAVRVMEQDIREGKKWREAKKALEEAEAHGESSTSLAMLRFAVALYAPIETED